MHLTQFRITPENYQLDQYKFLRKWLAKVGLMTFLALITLLSSDLKAQVFKTDTGYAEVKGGNGMTSYTGKSRQIQGTINMNKGSVNFQLPLKTLKTGNSVRDGHMRNTLETEDHPKTEFSGQIVNEFPETGQRKKITVKGNYTIHGVTKPMKVKGSVQRKEGQVQVKAEFPIKITEYGMEPPGFWFTEVNDKHTISIRVTLMPNNP